VVNGGSDLPVVPIGRRRFACDVGQITGTSSRVPCPIRGAFRDRHERWSWDAMDGLLRQTNASKPDGEVVWS
jgi:hypothetical protein